MSTHETFGSAFRRLRESARRTREEIATAIHLDPLVIEMVETDETGPFWFTEVNYTHLADLLNVDPQLLMELAVERTTTVGFVFPEVDPGLRPVVVAIARLAQQHKITPTLIERLAYVLRQHERT